jgi:hypothetical protein
MDILQGAINRDDYYSVKECSEILGVTTKTIRNRIDDQRLAAVWYEIGPGQSQWLIAKETIKALVDNDGKISRDLSVPSALINAVKAQIKAENEARMAENAQIREELREVRETQARIEKSLIERDEKLMQVIRERQEESKKAVPRWKMFLGIK